MLGSAVWIAPAVFATISNIAQRRMQGEPPPHIAELWFIGGDWLIYGILAPVIFAVCDRWPVVKPIVRQRLALHFVFALVTCVAWAVGGKILQFGLNWGLRRDEARQFIASAGDQFWQRATMDAVGWIFVTLPFGVIVYTCVAVLAHAMRYRSDAHEREVQLARVSEQLASARFAALQAQLNPHFLFNTLNTIAVRARDGDDAGTVRMVEQLSDLLRRTLTRHQSSEVTLEEELDLVRQYVAIEQARFPDRLSVTVNVERTLQQAAVPGFALQHLVENAIRHGIARRPGSGRVDITATRAGATLLVAVTDDGSGVDESMKAPAGRGIANTHERLRALYGDRASLKVSRNSSGGTSAVMRLPYRTLAHESGVAQR